MRHNKICKQLTSIFQKVSIFKLISHTCDHQNKLIKKVQHFINHNTSSKDTRSKIKCIF